MNRLLRTGLVTIAASAMTALLSTSAALAADVTLRFATITAEAFPYTDGAMKFKELVEERSAGDIEVLFYPGGQLGNEREINEAILEGSVQVGVGAGAMSGLAPIYNIVQIPFLIQGQDHMEAIALGPVGEQLAKKIEEQAGFRVLAWFSTGDSPIETSNVPVHTPSDLEGVKIRVIETPAVVDAMKALGANPTPMPYPEVYTGLKQGVVEGAHLDVISVDTLKIYEVIKYMTDWEQMTFVSEPRPVIMKAEYFDSLSPENQEIIKSSMQEAAKYEREVFKKRMDEIRASLLDKGIEITDVEPEAFIEKVKPVWKKYAEELDAQDLLDQIIAAKP